MVDEPSLADRILATVEAIPPGRVMTYGDVAEYVGSRSARLVGRVLALDGGSVPWHRVLHADGRCTDRLYAEQRQRLQAEGVVFRGERVELARFRWDGRPVAPATGAPVPVRAGRPGPRAS